MTTNEMETVERTWPSLAPLIYVTHTDKDYQRLVQMLDALIDIVGNDEDHPLASLMEVIGVVIEKYEDDHVPELA